jgi:hypothetical protein
MEPLKRVLAWNQQDNTKQDRPKKTWQRTVEEESLFARKSRKEVKSLAKKSN